MILGLEKIAELQKQVDEKLMFLKIITEVGIYKTRKQESKKKDKKNSTKKAIKKSRKKERKPRKNFLFS